MMQEINNGHIILDELLDINDWSKICSNYIFDEELIEMYKNKINWVSLSMYQDLTENIIEKYKDNINWFFISVYQNLTERIILKYKNYVNWKCISLYQELSLDFIIKNLLHIDSQNIFKNKKISKEIKKELIKRRIM